MSRERLGRQRRCGQRVTRERDVGYVTRDALFSRFVAGEQVMLRETAYADESAGYHGRARGAAVIAIQQYRAMSSCHRIARSNQCAIRRVQCHVVNVCVELFIELVRAILPDMVYASVVVAYDTTRGQMRGRQQARHAVGSVCGRRAMCVWARLCAVTSRDRRRSPKVRVHGSPGL